MQNTVALDGTQMIVAEIAEAVRAVMVDMKQLPPYYDIHLTITPDEIYSKLMPKHAKKTRRRNN